MDKKLTEKPLANDLFENDKFVINQGNAVKQVEASTVLGKAVEKAMGIVDGHTPADGIFFIEPNNADPRGAKYCTVGGNDTVRHLWCNNQIPILLDPKTGYFCRLDEKDMRFTSDGTQVFDGTNVNSDFANAEWMGIIPEYKQFIKDEVINGVTHQRVFVGYQSMPGGTTVAQQCIGMFKAYKDGNNKLHSRPGVKPSASAPIYSFWQYAQNTDPNCGLSGIEYRTYLLHRLMAKYEYRDIQNVRDITGSLVFGCGLDGSESVGSGETLGDVGFARQQNIKTGATLAGGKRDGNAAVLDSTGRTVHVTIDGVFEGDMAQYWEFVGNLCSLANDDQNRVVHILTNTMPKNGSSFITAPVLSDFNNIPHEILYRASSGDKTLVDAERQIYQALPVGSVSGVDDGDNMWYAAAGQVWIWGGDSYYGSYCGLGYSLSSYVWSYSSSHFSARLAFFGDLKETTSAHLKHLLAS